MKHKDRMWSLAFSMVDKPGMCQSISCLMMKNLCCMINANKTKSGPDFGRGTIAAGRNMIAARRFHDQQETGVHAH